MQKAESIRKHTGIVYNGIMELEDFEVSMPQDYPNPPLEFRGKTLLKEARQRYGQNCFVYFLAKSQENDYKIAFIVRNYPFIENEINKDSDVIVTEIQLGHPMTYFKIQAPTDYNLQRQKVPAGYLGIL